MHFRDDQLRDMAALMRTYMYETNYHWQPDITRIAELDAIARLIDAIRDGQPIHVAPFQRASNPLPRHACR